LAGIPYVAGRLEGKFTQRLDDSDAKHAKTDAQLEKHGEKLEDHGQKIGRLQEWKDGFNAAARVSGNKEVQ
jgi:hypothetical protein